MRLPALLLALALTACASSPPNDGVARVLVDGSWRIPGHTHGDDALHRSCPGLGPDGKPLPGGCAAEFRGGVFQVLRDVEAAGRARKQAERPASVATPSSPTPTEAPQ